MNKKSILFISIMLIMQSPGFTQDAGGTGSIARSATFGNKQDRMSAVTSEKLLNLQQGMHAADFIAMARILMEEGRYAQAKEALKTAIRLEPMNTEAWQMYDEATIAEYIEQKSKKKLEPEIESETSRLFEIKRVDTYVEMDTLYVVGSLKNLSNKLKQKIKVTAKILDKDKKELRSETSDLKLANRGLLPNESSLFEIPFKNPPADARSFKVEVTGFE
ncbi:MAG: hypothetical protein Kow0029_12600 [Candidatus Rifleibacteriota bacterium]